MITYEDSVIEDRLKSLTRKLDSGSGPGHVRVLDGVRPTTGAAITTQKTLVLIPFQKPSAGTYSNGVLGLALDTSPQTCVATGVASWGRLETSENAFVADCDAGASGSGKDLELSKSQLYEGGEVTAVIGTLTEL